MAYNFGLTPDGKEPGSEPLIEPGVEDQPIATDSDWIGSLLRPFLITILVGCIAVAAIGFLRHIAPALIGYYVQITLVTALAATFIGGYTTTLLVHPEQRHRRTWAFRAAEVGLILFLLRLAIWLFAEGVPSLESTLYSPLTTLFSGPFVVAAVLVYGTWILAVLVTDDFLQMGLQPDELLVRKGRGESRWAPEVHVRSDRQGLLIRFTQRWISGGVVMLFLTAGSQIGTGSGGFFAIVRQDIDPLVIGGSIVYFLIGLILIAVGRLAVLRAQWQLERIPAEKAITRNWPIYTGGLLLIAGVVAAILPLGGTFRLAQILNWVIRTVYIVIFTILGLIMAFISQFFPEGEPMDPPQPMGPITPPQFESAPNPVAVPSWIGGALFWVILALLLGYAAFLYMQERGVNFAWLRRFVQGLLAAWRSLWGEFDQWRGAVMQDAIPSQEEQRKRRGPNWWRRLSFGQMSPTERIRYFYLTTLDRAQEEGLGRKPGETPLRYAPRLEGAIDEIGEKPFSQLTEEFIEIQYAGHTMDDETASLAERLWQRIQQALGTLRAEAEPKAAKDDS